MCFIASIIPRTNIFCLTLFCGSGHWTQGLTEVLSLSYPHPGLSPFLHLFY
jgi:hypothetical protein